MLRYARSFFYPSEVPDDPLTKFEIARRFNGSDAPGSRDCWKQCLWPVRPVWSALPLCLAKFRPSRELQ